MNDPTDADHRDFDDALRSLARAPAAVVPTAMLCSGLAAAAVIGDRYRIEHKLGEGGMGEVFLGTDTRLHRRVAVKVGRAVTPATLSRQARLEAQALAKISHPNVVEIFEVGDHEGRPFIVMELIDGRDAEAWVRVERRTVEDTLTLYRQAGEGLAAAHAVGLVHRDFKPANVLVGDDGRVRVVDFGLAQLGSQPNTDLAQLAPTASSRALAGTLGFIPPEAYAGHEADAKGDQFSFCVSVWAALFDRMPFAGGTPRAVRRATLAGEVVPPRGRDVPAWAEAALRRGLRGDPAARHADMRALIRALSPRAAPPWRRRAPWAIGSIGAAGVLAAAAAPPPDASTCEGDHRPAWDRDASERVGAALRRTASPLADVAAQRVTADLDTWAEDWTATARKACASAAAGEAVGGAFACLDRAAAQLTATLEVLEGATRQTVALHRDLLAALDSPVRCGTDAETGAPRSVHEATDVSEVRAELDRVHALLAVGRVVDATGRSHKALSRARNLRYPPLVAEALFAAAEVARTADDRAAALELFTQAHEAALATRNDTLAARSARPAMWLSAYVEHDEERFELWRRAAGAAERRRNRDPQQAWAFLEARGRALHFLRRAPEARDALTRARELQDRDDVDLVHRLRLLSIWAYEEAKHDVEAARAIYVGALADAEARLAEDHPVVADLRLHFTACLSRLALPREALEQAERAVAIRRRLFGDRAPTVGVALRFVAESHRQLGALEPALTHARESLAIARSRTPPDANNEALAMTTLGNTLLDADRRKEGRAMLKGAAATFTALAEHNNAIAARVTLTHGMRAEGRYEEALEQLTLALDDSRKLGKAGRGRMRGVLLIQRAAVNSSVGRYADAHADLDRAEALIATVYTRERTIHGDLARARADVFFAAERSDEAATAYRRALAVFDRVAGSTGPRMIRTRSNLARALLDAGEPREALAEIERALALMQKLGVEDRTTHALATYTRGEALFWLGRRTEAQGLVREAHAELTATGRDPFMQDVMRQWLDDPAVRLRGDSSRD